jgi:competence protein ComGC
MRHPLNSIRIRHPEPKRKLPIRFVEFRKKIRIRFVRTLSAETFTNDLQNLYAARTNPPPGTCLMERCSRILRPVAPALAPWRQRLGREFDEPSPSFNSLRNMKNKLSAIVAVFASLSALAGEPAVSESAPEPVAPKFGLQFHEINYDVKVSDDDARLVADVSVESSTRQEVSQILFDGELAMLPPKLPSSLRIERTANQYRLFVSKPGRFQFKVEVVGKVKRAEPWNQVSFTGPPAAIASVTAQASGSGVDLQLLSGTLLSSGQTNGVSRINGFLGTDQVMALRWSRSGAAAEVTRKAVVTSETAVTAQITPTVIKYVSQIRYEVIQGKVLKLAIALPANQALTRLVGEQIRDWELKPGEGAQRLEVQFIKPIEKEFTLTLYSEETVETMPSTASLNPPQPIEVERESGSLNVSAEDTVADVQAATGLRQINAPSGALAAYRFNTRPFHLELRLQRIEPVISVMERVSTRLEETRLLSTHTLTLNIEKAGIYAVELLPAPGFLVADVHGEGVEDWKTTQSASSNATLRVNFSSRVLGTRKLEVQLEEPLKTFPDQISIASLRVVGATKEVSEIGAASAAGLRLKTAELIGLREVPVRALQARSPSDNASSDELLGYKAEVPDWKLSLTPERLAARVVAEIFNLVTIGDGIIGGSATIRYGLINQGVQEFDIAVPTSWKNVDFTGPNIRRKESRPGGVWRIGLQDKAWGGYTIVVTYDYQFDPKGAAFNIGGIHALGAERETGSVAITTAASLKLSPKTVSESLRSVDEMELAAADRGLITRSVLLAYQYSDPQYNLELDVKRFEEVAVLSAIADRTQLTTVLTEAGEMLTQASFMVKNNDKQFQKFKLPAGADFWSCHVNGQPVKAERDGDWVMAPLPRGANRDQAFGVDIVYRQKKILKTSLTPRAFALVAPQTDVPNTYAEWQLYAPTIYRLSGFEGNMTPVRGTTYDLQDAWLKFTRFYWEFMREAGPGLFMLGTMAALVMALIGSAIRRGWGGVINVLVVFAIIAILAAMLLPALSRAKSRAQRINAVNSLKQIGVAARTWAIDNDDRLPATFEDMMAELSTDKITYDPESGQRFIWVGGGVELGKIQPDSVIAFSPVEHGNSRAVLLADGSVQQLSSGKFQDLARRGWIVSSTPQQVTQNQQLAAVHGAQLQPATVQTLPVNATATPRLRSIRIEIPREGQAFTFTKVLNAGQTPLSVQIGLMKLRTFQSIQMTLQLSVFLAGILVWWWQWRHNRNTFILTLALALSLGAVGSLLLAWRLLHLAFIWSAPILVLAVLGWLTWKFWPRARPISVSSATGLEPGIPPAMASIAILACCMGSALAAPYSAKTTKPAVEVPNPQPAVSVLSANYAGIVDEHVAQFDVLIRVSTSAPGQKLPLFGDDVTVRQFSAKPGEATLVREGKTFAAVLGKRGETTLQLKLLVKLGGDVTRRQLSFAIPSALSSQLALAIDQPEADVEFPAAISIKRATAGQQTRLEAIIGCSERVDLLWTPRVKRAAEVAANVICQNNALVTFGNGVLNARAVLDYQITQGEMRQARVRLPAGHRLLRIEGDRIRSWEVQTANDEQVVLVDLLTGVASNYRLTVETERLLDALPAVIKTEIPHAVSVKRETGLLAIRADEELELAVEQTAELIRVDSEEFNRASAHKVTGTLNAFRFLKPEFSLQARVSAVQPQIETVIRNNFRIGADQINLSTRVNYTIKRAGVFVLKLSLPGEYQIEDVSGTNIQQWVEHKDGDLRVLEIGLKERTIGDYAISLELARPLKELPKLLNLAGAQPLGALKETAFVSVSVEPGVAVKASTAEGLIEIPAGNGAEVAGLPSASVLAYKFIGGAAEQLPWKLAVETEKVDSWVRAEIVNTLTLSDDLISGRALARFEIQNAPVKDLRLKIPASFKNVEISGPNIRRRDHDGEIWRVEFQSKIRGAHTLTVTWEEPRARGTNVAAEARPGMQSGHELNLQGIGAWNVERETGIFAIVARPPLQVTEQKANDLVRIDLRDLPDWAGHPDESTVLAYRYARPSYVLTVDSRRFAEAEVLQALVEDLHLSTVIADDGQMMTDMSLSVRNQGRQHLEIELPQRATVWSAFVAGQAVRPSVKEGKLLLPLEHSVGDEAPIAIQLVYIGSSQFPAKRGEFELISPKMDAPLKSAHWELFLPSDYRYSKFSGTMTHEVETAMLEATSFSFLDYSSWETKSKAQIARDVKSDISNAQKKLSSGNVKEALADYNRARARADLSVSKDQDTQKLEADLRRAQGNNLINAQNAFSYSNSGPAPAANPVANQVQYDAATAEAQWTKLQQAQELNVAAVQPIRVALPTRGLRHAFTQVLQTEIGKPMTVHLLASNTHAINWINRIVGPIAAFLVLWGIVTLITNRANSRRPVAAV